MSETIANVLVPLQKLETAAAAVGLTANQSSTKVMITGDKPTGEQITAREHGYAPVRSMPVMMTMTVVI